jgi:DNA-directed RNA polymerase II subunit RPB2
LLPHVGTDRQAFRTKAFFIGYMVSKLLYAYLGKTDEDDRDHYGKKRMDLTGILLISQFKDHFKNKFIESAKKIIRSNLTGENKSVK